MIKRLGWFVLTALALHFQLPAHESDNITYEWLIDNAAKTGYTDHIPHWRRLFNSIHVRGFLECGCGFSTKYFLDHADRVISVEYVTPGYGADWYSRTLELFGHYDNWTPILYNDNFRSNSFNNACAYQCSMHKDYALIDPAYLKELDTHFKALIQEAKNGGYEIDVAFVDPGVYVRGDMVKVLLANKIPIVVAHDTSSDNGTKEKENLYGWNKVVTPPDYVKIYIPFGQGTTFWINKKWPVVIASIMSYRDDIFQLKESGVDLDFDELTRIADSM